MIAQGIQAEPCRCPRSVENPFGNSIHAAFEVAFTTGNCMEFPLRNELFTFSTGFSTVFVKKKRSFPRCFPLFPPGFPHPVEESAIPGVMQPVAYWKVLGKNVGILPFIKKKVEGFSLDFTVRSGIQGIFSPFWNGKSRSFPQSTGRKNALWKSRGKRRFSTTKIACIQKENSFRHGLRRDGRSFFTFTSYSGTRAVRSGNTGSNCTHPRWW